MEKRKDVCKWDSDIMEPASHTPTPICTIQQHFIPPSHKCTQLRNPNQNQNNTTSTVMILLTSLEMNFIDCSKYFSADSSLVFYFARSVQYIVEVIWTTDSIFLCEYFHVFISHIGSFVLFFMNFPFDFIVTSSVWMRVDVLRYCKCWKNGCENVFVCCVRFIYKHEDRCI